MSAYFLYISLNFEVIKSIILMKFYFYFLFLFLCIVINGLPYFYSPELTPSDYFLFTQIKNIMKGKRFLMWKRSRKKQWRHLREYIKRIWKTYRLIEKTLVTMHIITWRVHWMPLMQFFSLIENYFLSQKFSLFLHHFINHFNLFSNSFLGNLTRKHKR